MPEQRWTFERSAFERLPQAAFLSDEQIVAWCSEMQARGAGESRWSGLPPEAHFRRLGGFGASEIGVLVGERRGEYSPFATARELVAQKLLLELPAPADDHMRRGIALEPLLRRQFLEQTGARALEPLTGLAGAHSPARHPWMQCTPDDFVELDNRLIAVDYKVPAEPLGALSLHYACQLHQIAMVAEDLGYPVDLRAVVAWNHPRGRPEVLVCPRDPALEAEIVAAGEHYWNGHVLRGELPPWPERAGLALGLADLSLEAKAELEALAERWLRLEVLAKEARRLTDEARAALEEGCRSHRLTQAVESGPVRIKPRAVWDPEAVEARLADAERARFERGRRDPDRLADLVRALGGDPDEARTSDDAELDVAAAARWLVGRGVPETALQKAAYSTSLSRRKIDRTLLEPIRAEACARAAHFEP